MGAGSSHPLIHHRDFPLTVNRSEAIAVAPMFSNRCGAESMTTESFNRAMSHVYVVDDSADARQSLACALKSVGYAVTALAAAEEFLSQPPATAPCAAVVDNFLPGMTGLNLCREIVNRRIPCSFIVISAHADVQTAVEVMRLGAIDLLEKPFRVERLLEAVHQAQQIASASHQRLAEEEEAARRLEELSPRERDVFDAVSEGLVTKEIANRLGVSARTVDVHRSRVMQKLRIDSPVQLGNLLAVVKRKPLSTRGTKK